MPEKVFAQIIIDGVRHHLLEHQRPEQSAFTPKSSMIDRILVLRWPQGGPTSYGYILQAVGVAVEL